MLAAPTPVRVAAAAATTHVHVLRRRRRIRSIALGRRAGASASAIAIGRRRGASTSTHSIGRGRTSTSTSTSTTVAAASPVLRGCGRGWPPRELGAVHQLVHAHGDGGDARHALAQPRVVGQHRVEVAVEQRVHPPERVDLVPPQRPCQGRGEEPPQHGHHVPASQRRRQRPAAGAGCDGGLEDHRPHRGTRAVQGLQRAGLALCGSVGWGVRRLASRRRRHDGLQVRRQRPPQPYPVPHRRPEPADGGGHGGTRRARRRRVQQAEEVVGLGPRPRPRICPCARACVRSHRRRHVDVSIAIGARAASHGRSATPERAQHASALAGDVGAVEHLPLPLVVDVVGDAHGLLEHCVPV